MSEENQEVESVQATKSLEKKNYRLTKGNHCLRIGKLRSIIVAGDPTRDVCKLTQEEYDKFPSAKNRLEEITPAVFVRSKNAEAVITSLLPKGAKEIVAFVERCEDIELVASLSISEASGQSRPTVIAACTERVKELKKA